MDGDSDGESPADGADGESDRGSYRGLFGAFPFSVRATDSWIFRAYAVAGGLAAAAVTTIFVLGLVVLVASTASVRGGSLTLSRAFYFVVLLLVLAPMVAPVLFVARRHRRTRSTSRYDAAMGIAGFLVLLSLYVSVLISAPPGQRDPPPPALAPLVDPLYALSPTAAIAPPVLAAGLVLLVHRTLR